MRLLDERDPFLEWGPQTGDDDGTARGEGVLVGLGRVNGESAVVISYDVTVHGGREGLNSHAKVQRAIDVADQLNVPVFLLAEGGDLGVDEIPLYEERHNQIVDFARLSGRVPLVGIAFGPVYGMRALLLSTCDAIFATRAALVDLTDPGLMELERDVDLALVQQRSGMLDLVLGSDDEAIAAARSYAGLLTRALVPFDAPDEPEVVQQLRSIVPANPRRAFNAERLVQLIADPGTSMILRPRFGPAMVTAIARLGGRAVGFAANHPMHVAGAIDSPASDKLTRFIRICDAYGLPLIYLIDTPGLLAGPNGERSAMARHSTRPYFALHDLRVAIFTVTVRRAFGQGAPVMASGGGLHRAGSQCVLADGTTRRDGPGRSSSDHVVVIGCPTGGRDPVSTGDRARFHRPRERLECGASLRDRRRDRSRRDAGHPPRGRRARAGLRCPPAEVANRCLVRRI